EPAGAVVGAYLAVTAALAKDDIASAPLASLDASLAAAQATADGADKATLAAMRTDVASAVLAPDLAGRREILKKVSAAMIPFARKHAGGTRTLTEAWCPMANAGWLQEGGTIANPYYGSDMLTCGSFK
ncbi:MAG: hypothetical protein Q8P41_29295, partial [Pseudomonadota bacterium]|nr:hypothetical protein [Pseudomonadota bacterium]